MTQWSVPAVSVRKCFKTPASMRRHVEASHGEERKLKWRSYAGIVGNNPAKTNELLSHMEGATQNPQVMNVMNVERNSKRREI